jgi:hypothetical protein
MAARGVSPASEKEAFGEGRIEGDGLGRRGTKPLTSQLAAVEAAEQAQNFRVAGGVLAGIGEEGCWRGESRDGLGETVSGGGGGSMRRQKNLYGSLREEEDSQGMKITDRDQCARPNNASCRRREYSG